MVDASTADPPCPYEKSEEWRWCLPAMRLRGSRQGQGDRPQVPAVGGRAQPRQLVLLELGTGTDGRRRRVRRGGFPDAQVRVGGVGAVVWPGRESADGRMATRGSPARRRCRPIASESGGTGPSGPWSGPYPAKGNQRRLMLRVLVARLFVQLLGHGVWRFDDDSWRAPLAQLTEGLRPRAEDGIPDEAVEHVTAVTPVCMGLLLNEASLTGGAPHDLLAARTWQVVKERVARAETDIAAELLIPPRLAHAHVLGRSGRERLLDLAHSVDPVALIAAELAEEELTLESDHGIHRVTGRFSNPVPVASRVAPLLGRHLETVLVHAVVDGRWTFVAWRRPHLAVAGSRAMWPGWRVYRVPRSAIPESRLIGGEGPPRAGLVAGPVR